MKCLTGEHFVVYRPLRLIEGRDSVAIQMSASAIAITMCSGKTKWAKRVGHGYCFLPESCRISSCVSVGSLLLLPFPTDFFPRRTRAESNLRERINSQSGSLLHSFDKQTTRTTVATAHDIFGCSSQLVYSMSNTHFTAFGRELINIWENDKHLRKYLRIRSDGNIFRTWNEMFSTRNIRRLRKLTLTK